MDFWDVVWFIIITFAFTAYLMMLFSIVADLFRDRETSGLVKAVWLVALLFLPLITALVYVIARGHGMADRTLSTHLAAQKQQEAYIKQVAGSATSPTDQIAQASAMLDKGTITQSEFDTLKAKALADLSSPSSTADETPRQPKPDTVPAGGPGGPSAPA